MNDLAETFGKIVIKKTWGSDNVFRYLVYLRLPTEVPVERLTNLIYHMDDYNLIEVRKKDWKNKEDDLLWEIISKEDKRPIPKHKYLIELKSNEDKDVEEVEWNIGNALEELNIEQLHLLINVKKVKRFSYEKEKKVIPITKNMLDKIIKPGGN